MLIQFALTLVFLLLLLNILQQRTLGLIFKTTSVIVVLVASYVVIFPAVTTRVAHFAGVGRGADLIIYLCMAVGAYLLTMCYVRLKNTELRIARMIQHLAIDKRHLEELAARINAAHEN
jgi:hypothetical protein